jgi:hypothetical protein
VTAAAGDRVTGALCENEYIYILCVFVQAIRILIEERLSPEAVAKSSQKKEVQISVTPTVSL